jgi:hypothetical protein
MPLEKQKQPVWDSSAECYDDWADYYDITHGRSDRLPTARFYQDRITDRGAVRSLVRLRHGYHHERVAVGAV